MNLVEERKYVGRLVIYVLTGRKSVHEVIKNFPETKDPSIMCAYHALVHFEADEDIRYKDIEYREAQDDYLETLANILLQGNVLPQNIILEYKEFYTGRANMWKTGFKGFLKEFLRYINIK